MFRNVRSILLDPSCSSSSMTNRLDHLLDIASSRDTVLEHDLGAGCEKHTAKRLQSLADFQLKALRKAFSFPQGERVVYTTCSIFQKENEEVVAQLLKSEENICTARPFVSKPALISWPHRGLKAAGLSAEEAEALVRANGLEDLTNGFFVANFERMDRADGEAEVKEDIETTSALKGETVMPQFLSSIESEVVRVDKKRKVLSATQKENRKRRKRKKRRKNSDVKLLFKNDK